MTATTRPNWTITATHVNSNGWHNVTEETMGRYTGSSEFYSGLSTDCYVTIVRTTYFRPDGTVSHVAHCAHRGGASLAVNVRDLILY
jgi:hypothetical protein